MAGKGFGSENFRGIEKLINFLIVSFNLLGGGFVGFFGLEILFDKKPRSQQFGEFVIVQRNPLLPEQARLFRRYPIR